MSLSARDIAQLNKIIKIAQTLLASADTGTTKAKRPTKPATDETRRRRTGKELLAFQKLLKAERKQGIPVTKLAAKHGISPAYIYQMK